MTMSIEHDGMNADHFFFYRLESVSSISNHESLTMSFASTTLPIDSIFDDAYTSSRTAIRAQDTAATPCPSQQQVVLGQKISELSTKYDLTDLDYEVFRTDDPRYHVPNKISLPTFEEHTRSITPSEIARKPAERAIIAVTGTTGCVQGTMMRQPRYIKMEGSETFREMRAVKTDRKTSESEQFHP